MNKPLFSGGLVAVLMRHSEHGAVAPVVPRLAAVCKLVDDGTGIRSDDFVVGAFVTVPHPVFIPALLRDRLSE